MISGRKILAATCGVTVILAQNSYANVIGTDFQNFNPTSNGIDFVTVQSSETLAPGLINLGLFLNYSINPLPEFADQKNDRGEFRNSLTGLDLGVGFGLTKNLEIGFNMPITVGQSIDEDNERIQLESSGINEMRLNMKYRLVGNEDGGLAVAGAVGFNTIENNPYAGDPASPIYQVELVADTNLYGFGVAGNLGYRHRSPGEPIVTIPVEPLGSQIIYSTAISKYFQSLQLQLIGEIYGSEPADDSVSEESQKTMRSMEGLLGAKYLYSDNLAMHTGVATYLHKTASSPDLRVYAGVNYVFGPIFKNSKNKRLKKRKKPLAPIPPPSGIENLDANPQPSVPLIEPQPEVYVLENIEFGFNSFRKIKPGSLSGIDRLGQLLLKKTFSRIVVAGHTDSLGSDSYNNKLSLQRAETVRTYLLQKFSIVPDKVVAKGFGESQPIADNATLQGRQKNRRVEFRIFD